MTFANAVIVFSQSSVKLAFFPDRSGICEKDIIAQYHCTRLGIAFHFMQWFQSALAYFAMTFSYTCKLLIILTRVVDSL